MTYKDVLLAIAGTISLSTPSWSQAQDAQKALTANIGSQGEIITGSDWIAKVSRANDEYVIDLKANVKPTHDCDASIPANAAPKGVEADDLMTIVSYPSDKRISVETFYEDHVANDDVPKALPFKLSCKP